MQAHLITATGHNPYNNLALENYLVRSHAEGVLLYLWQNAHTVVVGKHQNAHAVCNLIQMEQDGIRLARRLTGGGAVYHHLGNLNFSFVAKQDTYDTSRQFGVILAALAALGIRAEQSGRNDLCVAGKKCSGNAFLTRGGVSLHHGTLLVNESKENIAKYLAAPTEKLRAHGVKSVPARVTNLAEHCTGLSVETLSLALQNAFAAAYGAPAPLTVPQDAYAADAEMFASSAWILGKNPRAAFAAKGRLPFGEVQVHFDIIANRIQNLTVFSDALDTALPDRLARALQDAPYEQTEILARLQQEGVPNPAETAAFFTNNTPL